MAHRDQSQSVLPTSCGFATAIASNRGHPGFKEQPCPWDFDPRQSHSQHRQSLSCENEQPSIAEILSAAAAGDSLFDITAFENDWQEVRHTLVQIAHAIKDGSRTQEDKWQSPPCLRGGMIRSVAGWPSGRRWKSNVR